MQVGYINIALLKKYIENNAKCSGVFILNSNSLGISSIVQNSHGAL